MKRAFELLQQTGLPKGVVNLIHGGKTAVDTILDHPKVRAVSLRLHSGCKIYLRPRGAASGKRASARAAQKSGDRASRRRHDYGHANYQ